VGGFQPHLERFLREEMAGRHSVAGKITKKKQRVSEALARVGARCAFTSARTAARREMAWQQFATNHGMIRSLCAVAWAPASHPI
jgi:hypothetical protein